MLFKGEKMKAAVQSMALILWNRKWIIFVNTRQLHKHQCHWIECCRVCDRYAQLLRWGLAVCWKRVGSSNLILCKFLGFLFLDHWWDVLWYIVRQPSWSEAMKLETALSQLVGKFHVHLGCGSSFLWSQIVASNYDSSILKMSTLSRSSSLGFLMVHG